MYWKYNGKNESGMQMTDIWENFVEGGKCGKACLHPNVRAQSLRTNWTMGCDEHGWSGRI